LKYDIADAATFGGKSIRCVKRRIRRSWCRRNVHSSSRDKADSLGLEASTAAFLRAATSSLVRSQCDSCVDPEYCAIPRPCKLVSLIPSRDDTAMRDLTRWQSTSNSRFTLACAEILLYNVGQANPRAVYRSLDSLSYLCALHNSSRLILSLRLRQAQTIHMASLAGEKHQAPSPHDHKRIQFKSNIILDVSNSG
jgi:hypothetical protein